MLISMHCIHELDLRNMNQLILSMPPTYLLSQLMKIVTSDDDEVDYNRNSEYLIVIYISWGILVSLSRRLTFGRDRIEDVVVNGRI